MTETASQVLATFDALPSSDQREVAAALLRRTMDTAEGDVAEDALLSVADSLFQELDAAEDRRGKSDT